MKILNLKKGFTLIEALIAIGIFAIISGSVYSAYLNVLDITVASQINTTALTVIGNELEIIRNIKYQDIGTQGGAPSGIIPSVKNINFGGYNFSLNTTVRSIDDPFDGTLGGSPNDISPGDYKLVEIYLTCSTCPRFIPITSTTTVGPANLESSSKNGNLFVNAIDASGQPIAQANVTVTNSLVNPTINISDVTNNSGQLQLVDIATSSLGYQITVTKSGYSTDRTYQPSAPSNPNPVKPHATVAKQQVTIASFAIDRLSAQTLSTINKFCQSVPDINFNEKGAKLIGTGPDVLKYSVNDVTNSSGVKSTNLEWDNYTLSNTDTDYDIGGTTLLSPFTVNPNTNFSVAWLMEPKTTTSLMVTVQNSSGQMLNDASVTLTKTGFSSQQYTAQKFSFDTDWANGNYDSKSSNMETDSPAGQLTLKLINGKYASASDEWLVSKTIDFGNSSTNFYNLAFNPASQSAQTSIRIQIATNNDNATWNFMGPDGTPGSYYTATSTQLNTVHNGNRYLRYKVILRTDDHNFTARLLDLSIVFNSLCIPNGQVFFSGLSAGTYTLNIQKTGYQNFSSQVNVSSGWQEYRATLNP